MHAKILLTILAWVCLVRAAGLVDIVFYDSTNRAYRTATIAADLKSYYGHDFPKIRVLLIETPSPAHADYVLLNEALEALEHGTFEEHRVLCVVACAKEAKHSSYHTSVKTALKLSDGKYRFRVRLLDSSGAVLKESFQPLSRTQLQQWLKDK